MLDNNHDLSSRASLVLQALGHEGDPTQLALLTGLSEDEVQQALNELKDKGFADCFEYEDGDELTPAELEFARYLKARFRPLFPGELEETFRDLERLGLVESDGNGRYWLTELGRTAEFYNVEEN
jgi:Mn-dependent DtxR family transcriptional regulator